MKLQLTLDLIPRTHANKKFKIVIRYHVSEIYLKHFEGRKQKASVLMVLAHFVSEDERSCSFETLYASFIFMICKKNLKFLVTI